MEEFVVKAIKRWGLTLREAEYAVVISEGISVEEIANRMCRTQSAVKFQIGKILKKMGATRRLEIMGRLLELRGEAKLPLPVVKKEQCENETLPTGKLEGLTE